MVSTLWPNSTIVCVGSGPSLLAGDVALCRGVARVIAINDAVRLAPWADVLYACDAKWWRWHPEAEQFAGLKFGLITGEPLPPYVTGLRATGELGLEDAPDGVCHGKNSGYQAINVAVHLGATRILLLGYDMSYPARGASHFFGEHPDGIKAPYHTFISRFDALVEPLQARGIEIINCSRQTALSQFQRVPIERVLSSERAA